MNADRLNVVFRKASAADLPAIYAIHDECFGQYNLGEEAHRQISMTVDRRKYDLTVAEDTPGHIAGFCLSSVSRGLFSRTVHISMLGVTESARHHGLGRAFMARAEEQAEALNADAVTLSVSASNDPALRLYRGLGYNEYGREERFYPDGSTGIGMEKKLH
jgi:ribosomal-protein-alanine N-acetyltransferase